MIGWEMIGRRVTWLAVRPGKNRPSTGVTCDLGTWGVETRESGGGPLLNTLSAQDAANAGDGRGLEPEKRISEGMKNKISAVDSIQLALPHRI